MDKIYSKIKQFKQTNDIHQFRLILEAAELFITQFANGVRTPEELDLGIGLIRELNHISLITSLREYEYNYDLDREIRHQTIRTFKLCIPESHKNLRGLTELLVGMKENSVG